MASVQDIAELKNHTDALMQAEGYAPAGEVYGMQFDGIGLRYRAAAHPVLTERMPPIDILYSGLDIVKLTDPAKLARDRVQEVMQTP